MENLLFLGVPILKHIRVLDKIKVNRYIFRGSKSIFIFASLTSGGLLLKERICSPRSKFFSIRIDFTVFLRL